MDMNNNEPRVLDFQAFKARKAFKGDRKMGLVQTFTPPSNVTQGSFRQNEADQDLASRIERIKSSINRINDLMVELKSMSPKQDPKDKV